MGEPQPHGLVQSNRRSGAGKWDERKRDLIAETQDLRLVVDAVGWAGVPHSQVPLVWTAKSSQNHLSPRTALSGCLGSYVLVSPLGEVYSDD